VKVYKIRDTFNSQEWYFKYKHGANKHLVQLEKIGKNDWHHQHILSTITVNETK